MWKLNIRFHFFSFRRDWLLIGNYISLVMCKFSKNICWTFARRFPLFMTIKFLLLRTYASFCYRWSLLPKFALSNRNMSQKWKKTELSGANLENATFANLLSSRVSTSFALNLLLSITFLQHICSEQILFVHIHFFSFSAKTAIIAPSNNSHNLWITLITVSKIRWIPHKNVADAS